jgi:hypothetical protein
MNKNGISNPAFRVNREPEGLRVRVPVKADSFRSLLNLVWLLVWGAAEAAIILFLSGTIKTSGAIPAVSLPLGGLFLAAFTIAGGFVLWRWLWGMGGMESFLVERHALLVRREIWGVGHSRRFDLDELRSIQAERLNYRMIYPLWGRMFIGHDEGEIVIVCGGHTHSYGKGLREDEAWDLVELLQDEMAVRFQKPRFPASRSAFNL